MSLTSQDLQAISTLMDEKLEKKLAEQSNVILAQVDVLVDKKFEQQTKLILTKVEVLVDKKFEQQTKAILTKVDVLVDKKLEQQTKDISEVINQALSTVDEMYATKVELAQVNQRISLLERTVALG